jgi:TonB family protein
MGIALEPMGEFPLAQERLVSSAKVQQWVASLALGLLAVTAGTAIVSAPAMAQEEPKTEELARKAKTKVAPIYPDIARRMSISGVVKLAVVVAPNGTVKSSKAIGGHPVLVNAAQDALKHWKFEPAPTESSGVVEFKFQPQN